MDEFRRRIPSHILAWCDSLTCSTLDELILKVQELRGRELLVRELVPCDGLPWVAGQWFHWGENREKDLVLHLPVRSELYRRKLVCHELAHMLLGHPQRDAGCSVESEEREAEILALYLLDILWRAGSLQSRYESVFA